MKSASLSLLFWKRRRKLATALAGAAEALRDAHAPALTVPPAKMRVLAAQQVILLRRWAASRNADHLALLFQSVRFAAGFGEGFEREDSAVKAVLGAVGSVVGENARTEELGELTGAVIAVGGRHEDTPPKTLRVLFIGDCLIDEIRDALAALCRKAQIRLELTSVHTHLPAALRNELRALTAAEPYDAVFFSPFSYTFSAPLKASMRPQVFLQPKRRTVAQIDAALEEVCETLTVLSAEVSCPVFVHDFAGVVQFFSGPKGWLKRVLTAPRRRIARARITARLKAFVRDQSAKGETSVHLIDEGRATGGVPERQLSELILNDNLFHFSLFGIVLARAAYFDALYALAHLNKKKVVVCDLDNTLWDGLIGEGAVTHLHERQAILQTLRRRGVLLAVCSKNEAANVHWNGATLTGEDFVSAQISWAPKATGVARIRDELNLKVKDFVFIDDRPDERAQVKDAHPEIQVMDATDPLCWARLARWADLLPGQVDEDRTRMYRERAARERSLREAAGSTAVEDQAAALRSLGLTVKIRESARADLKRAAELVNRSNQFNLCGSRVSTAELEALAAGGQSVVVAFAEDKFGPMGMVGVLVSAPVGGRVEIPLFVLSCRVFGYGIEYAMVAHVQRHAAPGAVIVGHCRETPHNGPGRAVYRESGFRWDGERWLSEPSAPMVEVPWLAVAGG